MAFFGILGKSDTGLKPIIYRSPVSAAPVPSASAALIPAKAIVRAPIIPPKVEAVPPPPAPPPPPPVAVIPKPVAPPVAPVVVVAPPPPLPQRAPAQPTLIPKTAKPLMNWGPAPKPSAPAPRGADLAHLRQGVVLQARGEHEAAVEAFTKAIAADAACIEAYASRGISREALGDVAGARADYAKSIEVEVKAGIARHLAEA